LDAETNNPSGFHCDRRSWNNEYGGRWRNLDALGVVARPSGRRIADALNRVAHVTIGLLEHRTAVPKGFIVDLLMPPDVQHPGLIRLLGCTIWHAAGSPDLFHAMRRRNFDLLDRLAVASCQTARIFAALLTVSGNRRT
jgi:hypothetical protein